jgi:hypothetical protein
LIVFDANTGGDKPPHTSRTTECTFPSSEGSCGHSKGRDSGRAGGSGVSRLSITYPAIKLTPRTRAPILFFEQVIFVTARI